MAWMDFGKVFFNSSHYINATCVLVLYFSEGRMTEWSEWIRVIQQYYSRTLISIVASIQNNVPVGFMIFFCFLECT